MGGKAAALIIENRGRGRPREFDMDNAIDQAVLVFRERGYHATSITDLADAMGLVTGSIYKAFKDKRAIFIAALSRYLSVRRDHLQQSIQASKNAREKLRNVLIFYVKSSYGLEGRRGCLIVGSAVELATFDPDVAKLITNALNQNESFLSDLIRQGRLDGSINTNIDCDATARLMFCLLQGLRVVGKAGQTRKDMMAVVDISMKLLD